jgi:beta-glucosidase
MSVDALLHQLTLEEKAALTSGSGFWYTVGVDRLGIRRIMVSDGPHGLRAQPEGGDHIGLNGSIPATCFPPAATVASSWDPALVYEVGQAIAQEARAINLSVVLGPGVNIKRSPLCGRNFEYLSEDPFLAGELGVGMVDGIQSKGVGTSLKHFAANNQETDRLRVSAEVSERALREIYLPAFEKVVTKSQPWTVMCSYNKINGVSSSENRWLLTDVLRDEWGFEGLVMSDWGAVYDRVAAVAAGLDLEMPPALPYSPDAVVAAVKDGTLPESVLDERVRAVLRLAERGEPILDLDESYDQEAHHALARRVAGESAVLLTNDGLLPIAAGVKVAVIGEFARTPRYQGAGSSQVNPTRLVAPLDALSEVYETTFAPAYTIDSSAPHAALVAEAVATAAAADVVIMLLGLPGPEESEGFDRTHMNLPANQLAALAAVAAANPKVAVVLVNGSSVVLGDVTPHARALLEAWLGGQAGGAAIADVLSGAVNPSGRLAETLPHRLEDNSSYLNFPGGWQKVLYGEDVFVGYRGYDASHTDVAFPFGYGLSYTSFETSDLDVSTSGSVATNDLAASVSVTVTNTGEVAGGHVVQVYVSDPVSSIARPPRELKGFTKVTLGAGASTRVSIDLDQRAFSFWLEPLHRWVVEAGEFVIAVGNDSRDLPLSRTVTVQSPPVAAPLTEWSSYEEWLVDDEGRALLDEAAAAGQPDLRSYGDLVHVIGNFPLMSLTTFVGMSPDHDAVIKMAKTWAERHGAAQ